MKAIVNGTRSGQKVLVQGKGGETMPLVSERHGDGLPGGTLHAKATRESAGFMTPEQVRDLEEVKQRPVLNPADYAPADHDHPVQLPPHGHPEIASQVTKASADVSDLVNRVGALEARPVLDPGAFAPREHDHPPRPLQPHTHPEHHAEVDTLRKEVADLKGMVSELSGIARNQARQIKDLSEQVAFARRIVEDLHPRRRRPQEHGQQSGGSLHEAVTPRLSGFMTPELLRRLDALWRRYQEENT